MLLHNSFSCLVLVRVTLNNDPQHLTCGFFCQVLGSQTQPVQDWQLPEQRRHADCQWLRGWKGLPLGLGDGECSDTSDERLSPGKTTLALTLWAVWLCWLCSCPSMRVFFTCSSVCRVPHSVGHTLKSTCSISPPNFTWLMKKMIVVYCLWAWLFLFRLDAFTTDWRTNTKMPVRQVFHLQFSMLGTSFNRPCPLKYLQCICQILYG